MMKSVYSMMVLSHTSIALSSLFIPILARELGISYLHLGLIGMAYGLASFFSFSLFGRLSDLTGRRRRFVQAGLWFSALAFMLQMAMRDVTTMVLVRGLAGFSIGVFSFPLLAYVSRMAAAREKVGWYAGFGSLGWFAGYFLAGVVSESALAFYTAGMSLILAFFVSFALKEVGKTKVGILPFFTVLRRNYAVYLTYFLRHAGAQAVWLIFPIFLLELGASLFWVGLIHGLNTLTQFFVMGFLGRRGRQKEDALMIRLGLVISAAVFVFYFFSTSYLQVVPVQLLLGMGWSALYMGSLLHLLERNEEKATSTGLLGSTISMAHIVGPLLAGVVSQFFGLRAVMLVASGLSLAALAVSKRIH